jgi:hypothetical protein
MRLRLLLLLTVVAVLPATASAARPHPPVLVRLTSTPALSPAFAPGIHDYVVRCAAGTRTRFTTWAAAGTTPLIDGRPARTAGVALRPGRAVTVSGRNAAGEAAYHVRCLPPDFPSWTDTRSGATKAWYLVTPSLSFGATRANYVTILDGNGVPVWWYRSTHAPIDAKLLPGPTVAFSSFPVGSHAAYELYRLDGKLVRRVTAPDGLIDDHELQRDSAGNLFYLVVDPKPHVDLTAIGGPADGTVLESVIEEQSPSGKLLWRWSTDGHVDVSESGRWIPGTLAAPAPIPGGSTGFDLFHANAISLGPNGTVLLSMRNTDGVYAIDKASGRILWKLGGTHRPESLTVLNDPYAAQPLGGQHDVRLFSDGSITVFDDGTLLGRAPRAVRFAIDPVARTATLLQQLVDAAVTSSVCCGSARLLRGGDWLVSWGGDPVAGEYRPDGTPLFTLGFGGLFSYRVAPVAPRRLTIEELRAGMDAMAKP